MTDKELLAFTAKSDGILRELRTDVWISEPYRPDSGDPQPELKKVGAVWDTGATISVVTESVVKEIGLERIDEVEQNTANGKRIAGVYLVNIYLPNRVAFPGIRVLDGDIFDTDMLIGMDIITQGDLAITHKFKKTWLTFQVPSSHTIDFVNEIEIANGKSGFRNPKKKRKRR